MTHKINYNALGQAIDTTWGRSSTPLTTSMSVKTNIVSDGVLNSTYNSIVVFRSNHEVKLMKQREISAAKSIIGQLISNIKATYKKLTGQSLIVKQVSDNSSLEVIGLNVHTPTKRAVFKYRIVYEIA